MGEVRDLRSVARPIHLGNRKDKLEKRKREIVERHEAIKKRADELFKRK
jgi:hypothetical protein